MKREQTMPVRKELLFPQWPKNYVSWLDTNPGNILEEVRKLLGGKEWTKAKR